MIKICCGTILFTIKENLRYYVLVKQREGHVGLPKGHILENETLMEGALRETYEEVGIKATILSDFMIEDEYYLPNGNLKKVTFFLAEYSNQELNIDQNEVSEVFLLPFEEAYDMLTYEETKEVLKKANNFLVN